MNIITSYVLFLIFITWQIDFSEQIEQISKPREINACKGSDVDLTWKISEDENKISKLEWYFNNKTICMSSPTNNFAVETPYQGRIERIGKTAIRLKNVSLDDEGIFILFPLLAWSTHQNMQKLLLHILEPPIGKCICNISYMGHPSNLRCELTAPYCGRPQVSLVWKTKQAFEVLGKGNSILINSSFQDNEILCCLEGEAMKCVDDPRQFCTSASILHHDDDKPSEGGNSTQQINSVTTLVPQHRDTGNLLYIEPYVFVVPSTFSSLAVIIIAMVVLIKTCIKRKNSNNLADEWEAQVQRLMRKKINTSTSEQNKECVPIVEIDCKQHEAVQPVIKHDPVLETEEAVTVHQPTNDSETKIEVQKLPQAALSKICFVNKMSVAFMPYPVLEKPEALSENKPSLYLEKMREIQELCDAALCKICFVKKVSVVFMPCNHIATCAYCSIALQQCPVCRVLVEMKMNICFG